LKEVDDDVEVEDDASKVYMDVEFDDAYLSTEKRKFLLFLCYFILRKEMFIIFT
jgi:hypothetical protein